MRASYPEPQSKLENGLCLEGIEPEVDPHAAAAADVQCFGEAGEIVAEDCTAARRWSTSRARFRQATSRCPSRGS